MKRSLVALGFAFVAQAGFAQEPWTVEPPFVFEQLDEQAWHASEAAISKALRESDRPRDWALAATSPDAQESSAELAALLQRAVAQAPDDALVPWLAANRALALNDDTLLARSAEALQRLEPDNAATWIPVLALASRRQDAAAIDNAVAQMAAATRYDDHFIEALRVWMVVYDRHASGVAVDPEPSGDAFAAAMAKASAFALPAYFPLSVACKGTDDQPVTAQRRADCTVAGRLMLQRGSTLTARSIGAMLMKRDAEELLTVQDRAALRTLDWIRHQAAQRFLDDDLDSAALRAYAADWNTLDDEVEVIARAQRRAGLPAEPPPGWSPPRRGSG